MYTGHCQMIKAIKISRDLNYNHEKKLIHKYRLMMKQFLNTYLSCDLGFDLRNSQFGDQC